MGGGLLWHRCWWLRQPVLWGRINLLWPSSTTGGGRVFLSTWICAQRNRSQVPRCVTIFLIKWSVNCHLISEFFSPQILMSVKIAACAHNCVWIQMAVTSVIVSMGIQMYKECVKVSCISILFVRFLIHHWSPIDINECLNGMASCHQVCVNDVGSYHCACFTGFELNADNTTCSGKRWEVNHVPHDHPLVLLTYWE